MRGLRLIALRERLLRLFALTLIAAAFPAGAALAACDDCPEHRHGHHEAPAQPVAAAHTMPASHETPARRAALTKAQATRKLSARCRTLVRAKRPSKLSSRKRKARAKCLKQRAKLIRDSQRATSAAPGTPVPPTAPVPSAPAPPAPGPPPPAPVEPPLPPEQPSGPKYGAVGVTAVDGDIRFALTRGAVAADVVVFELANSDRQGHNLYIRPLGDERAESRKAVLAWVPAGVTQRAEVALAPGQYELICIVPGHELMTVAFTVVAPAA